MAEEQERGPAWPSYGADQAAVEVWVRKTFGDKIMDDEVERGRRVLKEAVELAQVEGVTRQDAHKIIDAVFKKPKGELSQELGGVIVTLLAACARHEIRLDDIARAEIDRVQKGDGKKFRDKQATKSALGIGERPE